MRVLVVATVAVFVLAACTGDPGTRAGARHVGSTGSSTSPPSVQPAPLPTVTTAPPAPTFDSQITPITDATRARMTRSWRPGCPVPLESLRLLALDYWGYDGQEHHGELVVHADYAEPMVSVFRTLFDARFPIERMELVDAYDADDHQSTLANNTSAFNCRDVVGSPGTWSEHAFGRAIDVNPRVNPYMQDPHVRDPELAPWIDRSRQDPGMIRNGDLVVKAFAAIGWSWGGAWSSPDYQHFSATGR